MRKQNRNLNAEKEQAERELLEELALMHQSNRTGGARKRRTKTIGEPGVLPQQPQTSSFNQHRKLTSKNEIPQSEMLTEPTHNSLAEQNLKKDINVSSTAEDLVTMGIALSSDRKNQLPSVDPQLNRILHSTEYDNDQKLGMIQQLLNRRVEDQRDVVSTPAGSGASLISGGQLQKSRSKKPRMSTSRKNQQLMDSYNMNLLKTPESSCPPLVQSNVNREVVYESPLVRNRQQQPQASNTLQLENKLFKSAKVTKGIQYQTSDDYGMHKSSHKQSDQTAPNSAGHHSKSSKLAIRRQIDCNTAIESQNTQPKIQQKVRADSRNQAEQLRTFNQSTPLTGAPEVAPITQDKIKKEEVQTHHQKYMKTSVQAKLRAQTAKNEKSPDVYCQKYQEPPQQNNVGQDQSIFIKSWNSGDLTSKNHLQQRGYNQAAVTNTSQQLRSSMRSQGVSFRTLRQQKDQKNWHERLHPQYAIDMTPGHHQSGNDRTSPNKSSLRATLPCQKVKSILHEFNDLPHSDQQNPHVMDKYNERIQRINASFKQESSFVAAGGWNQTSNQQTQNSQLQNQERKLNPIQEPKQYDKFVKARKRYIKPEVSEFTGKNEQKTPTKRDAAHDRREVKAIKSQLLQVYGDQLVIEPDYEPRNNQNQHSREDVVSAENHQHREKTIDVMSRGRSHKHSVSSGGNKSQRLCKSNHRSSLNHRSPSVRNAAQMIINRVAVQNSQDDQARYKMMLTNANELLTSQGIHGKIASVGVGFGTGRHTAKLNKSTGGQSQGRTSQGAMPKKAKIYQNNEDKRAQSPVQRVNSRLHFIDEKASVRSKNDQVSTGRFEAFQFDADCQTDERLLTNYLQKPNEAVEVETDPVIITETKQFESFMIQTEPMIYEPDGPREPESLGAVKETRIDLELFEEPPPEFLPILDKPIEMDHRDWAQSALFEHVEEEVNADLVSRGILKDIKQKVDVETISCEKSSVQDLRNLNPLDLEVLNLTECEYMISIVKKQKEANKSQNLKEKDLETHFQIAKVTCEVLIANLVSPELIQHILSSHYKEVTAESFSKLLMRVQQLYFVREKASDILSLAIELYAVFDDESVFSELLARDDKELSPLEQQVMDHVRRYLKKLQVSIELFKREVHLYKKEFIYKGIELQEQVQYWIQLLESYDLTNQTERENDYKRWLIKYNKLHKSEQELKPIDEAKLRAILVVKEKKASRVAQVVVPKLEEKPIEKKRLKQYRPISPINTQPLNSDESEEPLSSTEQTDHHFKESSDRIMNQSYKVQQLKDEMIAVKNATLKKQQNQSAMSGGLSQQASENEFTTNFDKWKKKNYAGPYNNQPQNNSKSVLSRPDTAGVGRVVNDSTLNDRVNAPLTKSQLRLQQDSSCEQFTRAQPDDNLAQQSTVQEPIQE